jgi:N utilization substance protein A
MFMETLNVDEVVGQLLASEGFNSVEELSMVDLKDVASIEGFDEDTAGELQERAQDYLARIEAEYDARRKELGVADELQEVAGVTAKMMVVLGENDVKTVEDLAGCATDDLAGWSERKDGETTRHAGYLDGFDLSREECEEIIMLARLKAGWITEAELAAQQQHEASAEEAEAEGEAEVEGEAEPEGEAAAEPAAH